MTKRIYFSDSSLPITLMVRKKGENVSDIPSNFKGWKTNGEKK